MAGKLKKVDTADLYEIEQIGGLDISPDGKGATFAVAGCDAGNKKRRHIFVAKAGGKPAQFTRGEVSDGDPAFSKDGKELFFISRRGGDKPQLWAMPVDGGEPRKVTSFEGSVTGFELAPDGKHAAVTVVPPDAEAKEREKKKKLGEKGQENPVKRYITRLFYKLDGAGFLPESKGEIHYVSLSTGKGKMLLDGKYSMEGMTFTPDGAHIVFASNRSENPDLEWRKTEIWKIRTDGRGKLAKIETFEGAKFDPAVTPDGKRVVFTGEKGLAGIWGAKGIFLWSAAIGGGDLKCLTGGLDRPPLNMSINDTFGIGESCKPAFSPDGEWVYFCVSSEGSTHLYRTRTDGGGAPEPILTGDGVLLGLKIDFAGDTVHYLWASDYDCGSYYTAKLSSLPAAGASGKRRYMPSAKYFSSRDFGKVESVRIPGKGGDIHGWILTPPGFDPKKKYPAILEVHGGPRTQYAHVFMHEFQFLAAGGYVVFYCNPRGGQGYGAKHVGALDDNWGGPDFDDIMSFTDGVLKKCSFIDKERTGITGGSYGGYMTCWAVGHTDRYKAAVTQRCVSNFISFVGSSDVGFHFIEDFKGRNPWDAYAHYAKLSPVFYAKNVKTPTLVIHSENDLRCPIEQGEQFYVALKLQGVETEMVRFPEESHGLSRGGRTDRRIERLNHIRGWFDKYMALSKAKSPAEKKKGKSKPAARKGGK